MRIMDVNGLQVFHHNNGQEMCTVRAILRAGSTDEATVSEYGSAHFLEHMFFKGTQKKTYNEINQIAARLGKQNAYTANERTAFHQSCVSDDFEKAAELICEMMFEPKFEQAEFERERGVIIEEYQTYMDDPFWYFLETLSEEYWGHRGHRIIGRKKGLQEMSLDSLKAFRDRNYKQGRAAFAVVGNIDTDRVTSFFSQVRPNDDFFDKSDPYCGRTLPETYDTYAFHHKADQGMIAFCGVPAPTDEQNPVKRYARGVFENGLGKGMHSLLFKRIREELGYCYHVRACDDPYRDRTAMIMYCMLDKKNMEHAQDEMCKIVEGVRTNGFSDDLLLTAKKNTFFCVAQERQTSGGFCEAVFDIHDITKELLDISEIKAAINGVTNQDVIEAARMFFPDRDHMRYFRMHNEEKFVCTHQH